MITYPAIFQQVKIVLLSPMPANLNSEWYAQWFNTPYYHLLYKHRDHQEAERFINNIVRFLNPIPGSRMLDLACGKGRHSIYMSKLGFDVTGVDLSDNSIQCAKQMESDTLSFYVHDMRKPFRVNYFHLIMNLFTSFGYFEKDEDDNAVINAVAKQLMPGGFFVFDYLNTEKVANNLTLTEEKKIEDISFVIHKCITDRFIVKKIDVYDQTHTHHFIEKVKILNKEDVEKKLSNEKLKVLHLFGDYELNPYVSATSDRLIMIAQKSVV